MRVEQQSLSAELSLTQTERPRSHGHRAIVLLQAEDPALPAGQQDVLLVEGSGRGFSEIQVFN